MRICGSAWFMKPCHAVSGVPIYLLTLPPGRGAQTLWWLARWRVMVDAQNHGLDWVGPEQDPKTSPVCVSFFFLFCPPLMLMMINFLNLCPKCNNIHCSSNNSWPISERKKWRKQTNPCRKKKPWNFRDASSHGTECLNITPGFVKYVFAVFFT